MQEIMRTNRVTGHGSRTEGRSRPTAFGFGRRVLQVILCSALAACGSNGEDTGAAGANRPRGGQAEQPTIPVRAEQVQVGEMVESVQTHARLEAERWVRVLARTTGLVEELLVEEGDPVRSGQVLLRLEKRQLNLQLEQARIDLDKVRSSFSRIQALHDNRMVSESEFEAARLQLNNAKLRYEEALLNLEFAEITAPISGVVMERMVELGDLVRANQELFQLAVLQPLLARINVPEKRMDRIRVGQEARLYIESLPHRVVTGHVRMINPGVDPRSGTVKVTIEIPDTEQRLMPGMFASVRIITEQRPEALVMPRRALIIETDDDDVFVVRDGQAQRVPVTLGFAQGDHVEILDGLQAGEYVITVGAEGLRSGTPVRIVGLPDPESTVADSDNDISVSPDADTDG